MTKRTNGKKYIDYPKGVIIAIAQMMIGKENSCMCMFWCMGLGSRV